MDCIEKRLGRYIREKGINLSKLSRDTGIPYISIYSSLAAENRDRPLRVNEYFTICDFLGVNPMDFAGFQEEKDATVATVTSQ